MSGFGRPPGALTFSPTPPERGSFPLDHEGECKPVMLEYLSCIKKSKGKNAPDCRQLAKLYLKCRMERNLMAPDDFKNLGFQDQEEMRKAEEEKGLSRLEQLKRENLELIKKRLAEDANEKHTTRKYREWRANQERLIKRIEEEDAAKAEAAAAAAAAAAKKE
ncbi:hypothetical protein EX30DRAFT_339092 [Ascodesmis nigricans]|uniref:Cytochrome c oxidase assembly protein COX19 n=1 Tax=Ascodesmis nigricans TaxID=341454 RepID=A0A4S2N116_9PEZI|nr:hypothetical protein EX30DRAFT_339092 [Ascodesmis nigricans]